MSAMVTAKQAGKMFGENRTSPVHPQIEELCQKQVRSPPLFCRNHWAEQKLSKENEGKKNIHTWATVFSIKMLWTLAATILVTGYLGHQP